MPVVIYFVALIILLSYLRNRLLFEMVGISLLIFGTPLIGKWAYSLLFLPGTILHELSHWLVAELLGVRTGTITILPEFEDGQERERLGSVQTASSGPLRGFLIGAAPFFTGLLTLWILGYLLSLGSYQLWQYVLLFYGVIVVGSSMMLSREDRRFWLPMAIMIFIVIFVLYQLDLLSTIGRSQIVIDALSSLDHVLLITVLAMGVVIGSSFVLRRIIEKLRGKKIVRRPHL